MAVLLEWVDGEAEYTQLKLAASPGVVPLGCESSSRLIQLCYHFLNTS